ncbi:hypothetical protein [Pimelobacter simplex]|uniref:hypothetical protein n=1 Tax=Nocardioides simplex TaxID=2045 RepID=UPI003AAE1A15
MVNDVRALLREAVATPPEDETDLSAVLAGGRRRVRKRRGRVALGAGLALGLSATALVLVTAGGPDPDRVAEPRLPRPEGPVLTLRDADAALLGRDYEVVASSRNKDLESGNGQYYDGVTEDGLVLFRDADGRNARQARLALLDPVTGDRQWLPQRDLGSAPRPLLLARDRLVFVAPAGPRWVDGPEAGLRAEVYDRRTRGWSTVSWPGLPADVDVPSARVAFGGRIYVGVGTGGTTSRDLWSVALDDTADVRDEGLRVGRFDLTSSTLVWTDGTQAPVERIHVRDLATGTERSFDPRSGARCNLLGLAALEERIVLSQYCGTYGDLRDDRVQVLTSAGRTVTTVQGSSLEGFVADDDLADNGHLVVVRSGNPDRAGSYVYDLSTARLLRASEEVSSWLESAGPLPAGYVLFATPYGGSGATQWLLRWRS